MTLKQTITFISCPLGAKCRDFFGQYYSLIYVSHFPLSMNERWGWTHMFPDSFKHTGNSWVITPNFCELHPNNNETVSSTEVNSIYGFFSVLNVATLPSALATAQLRPALLLWEPWRELFWGFFGGWDSTIWPPAELQHKPCSDSRAHTFSSSCL